MTAAPANNWYRLTFPRVVEVDQVSALLRAAHGLAGSHRRDEMIILQAAGRGGQVEHSLRLAAQRRAALEVQATRAVPGLVMRPAQVELGSLTAAWRLWSSSSRRPLRSSDPLAVSHAVLTALTAPRSDEQLLLQWLLGPRRRPMVVPTRHAPVHSESWPRALLTAPFRPPGDLGTEARRALRLKQGEAGWRAVGRIAVQAADRHRGLQLMAGLVGALRTAEGPGAHLGVRPIRPALAQQTRTPWRWGLALNVEELTALIAWPLGEGPHSGVAQGRSRLLPRPRNLPPSGRVLALEPHSDRPLAQSRSSLSQHLWLIGPTGVGKSTLLLRLVVQDMAAGRSVVVIEPKGDLIQDVLARVPDSRSSDVVVLDPADSAPVGLNPLAGRGAPDLIADQLLTIFQRLNSDSWGPRLGELLHAGLLTLARTPDMSLAALPPLLTNDAFRRRIVSSQNDPLGVSPIWAAFEGLSVEARTQAVAAVLNKVRVLTARPALRAVLGQGTPRFGLQELFSARRPILLANLAKGVIGPDSARLLGTILLNQLWQTALARSAIPPERRHLVSVVVDELQDYAGLPGDLGEMLAQARSLGVSFSLANQHLDQLSPSLRAGVLANARSRVVFQASEDDARVLARGHRELTPEDITSLEAFEVYVRLSVDGAVTPYFSGRTAAASPTTTDPERARARSRQRYGVPRRDTDAALTALVAGSEASGHRSIGRARRSV